MRLLLVVAAVLSMGLVAPASAGAPLPPPVEIRTEPQGVTLLDPAFEPLPGARADFGRLGGAVYKIEIPDDWNGDLVLEMHGFGELNAEMAAAPPDFRRYLIRHGYAWGSSSFSSSSFIPGRAADETAALWDYFARTYRRPKRTYITGWSMGGLATHLSAERYANRYDGALAFCGSATVGSAYDQSADYFAAGAYAAGVSQDDFDASGDVFQIIRDRIQPALADAAAHGQFEDIMLEITGGSRAFGRAGFHAEEATNWQRAGWAIAAGLASNANRTYELGPIGDVTPSEFNRRAVRVPTDDDARRQSMEGPDLTGDLQMPMLTMHTTGDGQVPIEQARILRRRVQRAGKENLLVQRVVRDPGHCGFRTTEQERAFAALVRWVERGDRPKGTDVLVDDLRRLDRTFELSPRGAGTAGAEDRVVVRGRLTLDGDPLDAEFLGAVVLRDGLVSPCQLDIPTVNGGSYKIEVAGETEVAGCGKKGAEVVLWTYVGETKLYTTETVRWPGDGLRVDFDPSFSTRTPRGAAPPTVEFNGEVFDANGLHLPGGTVVEAYIGDVLCGVGSTRRGGSYGGYIISVVGPESVPGCERGATITFRVDGRPVVETAVNTIGMGDTVDLTQSA